VLKASWHIVPGGQAHRFDSSRFFFFPSLFSLYSSRVLWRMPKHKGVLSFVFLSNLIIIILTVIYFILYIFQFHSHYLVSFNFYIKFSLYSFSCFFFIFLVIELYFQFHHSIFDFNFFMLNLVPIFFHCYLFGFGSFFNWFFFPIQSLSILLIENFVSLFFRVCLLWV
jgi:hypothetical protein